jgi:protein-tyrosine phosphatase
MSGADGGIVDLHCHVLPGIDDGAPDLEAAVAIARIAAGEGITTIVATPHTLDGVHDVPRGRALAARDALAEALAEARVEVAVRVAAEVRFHESIVEALAADASLSLDGRRRYLLLELPHESAPPALPGLLFRLRAGGTTPVIAHPERNLAVRADPGIVAGWVAGGALLQLTAGSLAGTFGEPIRACALRLLRDGKAHLAATDSHSVGRRPPRIREAYVAAASVVGEEGASLLFLDNPRRVLAGEPAGAIVPATPAKRRGFFAALRR